MATGIIALSEAGAGFWLDIPETGPAHSLTRIIFISTWKCKVLVKHRRQKPQLMQMEAEMSSSKAGARNLLQTYCTCCYRNIFIWRVRWCDSCKLYCFLQALQFWNGPAFVVFKQRTASEANYQEQ